MSPARKRRERRIRQRRRHALARRAANTLLDEANPYAGLQRNMWMDLDAALKLWYKQGSLFCKTDPLSSWASRQIRILP